MKKVFVSLQRKGAVAQFIFLESAVIKLLLGHRLKTESSQIKFIACAMGLAIICIHELSFCLYGIPVNFLRD